MLIFFALMKKEGAKLPQCIWLRSNGHLLRDREEKYANKIFTNTTRLSQ
jgi:hypothetical protein